MKPRQATIYSRFSPRPGADLCESIEVQVEACRKYCDQHDYAVVAEFADREASGDDEDRRELWAAVGSLRRGSVLVCHKQDRLARGVFIEEYIRREIRRRGATAEIVEGSRNGDAPEDVFVRQVMSAYAEFEKRIIAARTQASMLRHQQSGRAMSKIPPYGTQNGQPVVVVDRSGRQHVRQTLVANEAELATVERIVALDRKGMSRRRIARELAAEGIRARSGRRFDHKTIGRIIARAGG